MLSVCLMQQQQHIVFRVGHSSGTLSSWQLPQVDAYLCLASSGFVEALNAGCRLALPHTSSFTFNRVTACKERRRCSSWNLGELWCFCMDVSTASINFHICHCLPSQWRPHTSATGPPLAASCREHHNAEPGACNTAASAPCKLRAVYPTKTPLSQSAAAAADALMRLRHTAQATGPEARTCAKPKAQNQAATTNNMPIHSATRTGNLRLLCVTGMTLLPTAPPQQGADRCRAAAQQARESPSRQVKQSPF